jgi:anti-repressor protein
MIILSEKAVYKFLMRSQKKEAEPFQDWVADVLKTIRMDGRYVVQERSQKMLIDAEAARQEAEEARQIAEKKLKENEEALEVLRRRIKDKHQRGASTFSGIPPTENADCGR